jgi:hypothetical protein
LAQTRTSPTQRPKPRFHFGRNPGTSPSTTRIAPLSAPGWWLSQARRPSRTATQRRPCQALSQLGIALKGVSRSPVCRAIGAGISPSGGDPSVTAAPA